MMNEMIKKYEEQLGFMLVIDEEKITAKCDRPAPRARLGVKNEFYYRYQTVEVMYERLEAFLNDRVKAIAYREEQKKARKARAAELATNVKVGDIFVDSWGYEQTNVDFFEVVEKPTAKTIVVREIACERVEDSMMSHGMADEVRPVAGAFIGEPMKKRIDNYGGFKTNSFSCARPTEKNKKHYRSWYA